LGCETGITILGWSKWLFEGGGHSMEKDLAQQQLDALPLYLFCSLDMVIKIEEIKVQTTVYQTYWLGREIKM